MNNTASHYIVSALPDMGWIGMVSTVLYLLTRAACGV